MLHLLYGENDLQREEALAEIIRQSGLTPDLRDLNTEVLEAPSTAAALRRACSVIPFLGDVRIVIARELLSQTKGPMMKELDEIAAYLPDLPPSTILIFCESKALAVKHPVLEQAKKLKANIQVFSLPAAKDLSRWIVERTKMHRGAIEFNAATLLAQNIGPNLRMLDQEIRKLMLYRGDNKPITVEDVKVMAPYIQSADVIFSMVDAIGQRDPRSAATYLHQLLEVGEHPLGVFGMIVRQFRLLIQVRWLVDRGRSEPDMIARLNLKPFIVQKVRAQAQRFTLEQLRAAYQLLVDSDLAIKRGLLEPEAALDLLIVQLTGL